MIIAYEEGKDALGAGATGRASKLRKLLLDGGVAEPQCLRDLPGGGVLAARYAQHLIEQALLQDFPYAHIRRGIGQLQARVVFHIVPRDSLPFALSLA